MENTILDVFLAFMNNIWPALSAGVILPFLTQAVKKTQAIPINEGQKGRIVTFVAVVAFLTNGVNAYLNGTLEEFLSPETLGVGLNAVFTWVLAHFTYKNVIK